MIRLGKLTDYGLVLMTHMAQNQDRLLHTARDLAVESRLPLPTVSKLLKELLQGGPGLGPLLRAHLPLGLLAQGPYVSRVALEDVVLYPTGTGVADRSGR